MKDEHGSVTRLKDWPKPILDKDGKPKAKGDKKPAGKKDK